MTATRKTFNRILPQEQDTFAPTSQADQDGIAKKIYIVCNWQDVDSAARNNATAFDVEVTDGETVWSRKGTLPSARSALNLRMLKPT